MESSMGFMAVFAVSGGVVFLARQVHSRLLSDFMRKIEFELRGSKKCQAKKKVRFAEDVMEPSSNNKEYRRRGSRTAVKEDEESMPVNRQVLYKGIIEYKTLKGHISY